MKRKEHEIHMAIESELERRGIDALIRITNSGQFRIDGYRKGSKDVWFPIGEIDTALDTFQSILSNVPNDTNIQYNGHGDYESLNESTGEYEVISEEEGDAKRKFATTRFFNLLRELQANESEAQPVQQQQITDDQESVSGQPQLKLTSVSELEKFAEETTGKPADSLLNYWLNKSWFECWLLGNGLNTQYYVEINSLPGEEGITNILRRHDSESVVILDLGVDLEEGLSRLVSYFSGSIESGWYGLCDYDAEAEAAIELAEDKQWLCPLTTERELFDAMVARKEKDQLDSDKHEIYNSLDYLWNVMNERFTAETAYDLLVNKRKLCVHLGIGIYLESLVKEVAKDVLSVVQPKPLSALEKAIEIIGIDTEIPVPKSANLKNLLDDTIRLIEERESQAKPTTEQHHVVTPK